MCIHFMDSIKYRTSYLIQYLLNFDFLQVPFIKEQLLCISCMCDLRIHFVLKIFRDLEGKKMNFREIESL